MAGEKEGQVTEGEEIIDQEVDADDEEGSFDDEFDRLARGETDDLEEDLDDEEGDEEDAGDDDAGEGGDETDATDDNGDDDFWSEAPAAAREAYEAAVRERDEVKHRYSSDAGRVSGLQRKINELERALQNAQAASKTTPEIEGVDLEEFETDYPDIAKAVRAMVSKERAALDTEVNERIQQLAAPLKEAEETRFIEAQLDALTERHPKWREQVATEDFNNWLKLQPRGIQELSRSDYADDVSFLLDVYGNTRQPPAPRNSGGGRKEVERRRRQLENSEGVRSRSRAKPVPAEEDFDGAWEHYAKRQRG